MSGRPHHIMLFLMSLFRTGRDRKLVPSICRYADHDIMRDGHPVFYHQTNEAAVIFTEQELEMAGPGRQGLDHILCIATEATRSEEKLFEYIDDDGQLIRIRHVDLLAKELRDITDAKFQMIPYHDDENDSLKSAQANVEIISDIIERIDRLVAQDNCGYEDIVLHVDMTGGMRTSSMMMMAALQLLRYRGVKNVNVLYADYKKSNEIKDVDDDYGRGVIVDATDVYSMFNLISGADEFVNYGSLTEISNYFAGTNTSPEISKLLAVMETFCDDIRICRTEQIPETVTRMAGIWGAMTTDSTTGESMKENIFRKVLAIFKRQYGELLNPDTRNQKLTIIRWCIERAYYQQAITFSSEWLSEELIARGILVPAAPSVIENCIVKNRNSYKTWPQIFIVDYNPHTKDTLDSIKVDNFIGEMWRKKYFTANAETEAEIDKFLKRFGKSSPELWKDCDVKYREMLREKKRWPSMLRCWQDHATVDTRTYLYRFLWKLACEENQKKEILDEELIDYIGNLYVGVLDKKVANMSENVLRYTIGLPLISNKKKKKKKAASTAGSMSTVKDWSIYEQRYRLLLKKKLAVMSGQVEVEEGLELLRAYYDIHNLRNHTNHANGKVRPEDIRRHILDDMLDKLEQIPVKQEYDQLLQDYSDVCTEKQAANSSV